MMQKGKIVFENGSKHYQPRPVPKLKEPACRVCACTDIDCRGCIERTGKPCHWIEPDLCSACKDTSAR